MKLLGIDFTNVVVFRRRSGTQVYSCVNCGAYEEARLFPAQVPALPALPAARRC